MWFIAPFDFNGNIVSVFVNLTHREMIFRTEVGKDVLETKVDIELYQDLYAIMGLDPEEELKNIILGEFEEQLEGMAK